MYLSTEKKREIFAKYGKSAEDCGSPEAQIALFSYRIQHLTEHMKSNKKDYSKKHKNRLRQSSLGCVPHMMLPLHFLLV